MTKEYDDREIIEWLDGSVDYEEHCYKCAENYEATLSLEFMLEKLKEKEEVDSFYINFDTEEKPDEYWCEIEGYFKSENLVWAEGSYGKTSTLALRGAIVKLMEEEKDEIFKR